MNKKYFIVGKTYPFRYIKKIELDEEFFVFEDIYGERYLLSSFYYKNYQFKPGQEILCRILRIDCSGKVSIEPEHPFYKINKVYDFKFKSHTTISEENAHKFSGKSKKLKKHYLVVTDIYGNEHLVKANKKQKNKNYQPKKITCKVKSITKGNFELENMENGKRSLFKQLISGMIKQSKTPV
ncbi:MAG: hypothetical protein L3J74_13945 [Bacteroidales bacterium]|nr:hypothetical protein [Bacteroidales bacterium]